MLKGGKVEVKLMSKEDFLKSRSLAHLSELKRVLPDRAPKPVPNFSDFNTPQAAPTEPPISASLHASLQAMLNRQPSSVTSAEALAMLPRKSLPPQAPRPL